MLYYRVVPVALTLAIGAITRAQECEWSSLRDGAEEPVFTMITFDDGGGDALYIGGDFDVVDRTIIVRHVARWDGRSWGALGAGLDDGLVYSFAVFDDGRGAGPALYAGGSFETSGGKQVRGIAKWDGASWTEIVDGITSGATKPAVRALRVFDDGSGPALYAGGSFGSVGGEPDTSFIAKWDGERWSSVGGGLRSYVYALEVFDDGSGPALYAGGIFRAAVGSPFEHVAKWDGESWSGVGDGMGGHVFALGAFDDGGGPCLYAGGSFLTAGGKPARYIARWDGGSWTEVGGGMSRTVGAFAVFNDGHGSALYVGGPFTMAGETPASGIVRWDGKAWSSLDSGVGGSPVPTVVALAVYDDGRGPALYAGGTFLTAGDVPANNIARWRCDSGCYADCDGSGDLTFFDFLCFQNLFAAMDPGADCDGDSAFTFFDFLCFQNAFGAGCP